MGKATTIVGLTMALVLMTAAPAGAGITPTAVWPFNEARGNTAYDYSGHQNSGTLEGLAEWASGRFQAGLSFNGNASAVRVPDSRWLDSPLVSVSAWVNASASPGDYKYIVAKGANGCLAASYGLYTGANGGLEFYAATNSGLSWTLSPDAGTSVWDGHWHNVIGTYDGTTVRLYVDGQQVGSGTPDTAPISYGLPSSNNLTIGDFPGCSGLDFSGRIDEVKVFDRALAPSEIGLGYLLSQPLAPIFPFDLIG